MVIDDEVSAEGKEFLSCRRVLWYVTFGGFIIYAILETNVSLAIIGMVIPRPTAAVVAQCETHVQTTNNLSNFMVNASSLLTTISDAHNFTDASIPPPTTEGIAVQYPDRFSWNEYEQSLVLSGYFWSHWITHLPSGLLARRYGTKLIFGWANLLTALLGFLTPLCARFHLYALVTLRVAQGLTSGLAWPSMHHMVARWIPVTERSEFLSAYHGCAVGAAVGLLINGVLIDWFGWASVFYVTSALGVIWYIAWYYLAYDSPQEHPRISEAEKNYILENVKNSIDHSNSKPVPWKAILTSGPVWLVTISHTGCGFGPLIMGSEAPSYFNYIHGWNITAASVFAAAPHLTRMIFSYMFGNLADWILQTERMSTTNLRKLAILVSNGIQSIMLLVLAFSGCHSYLAIVFMIIGITATGSASAGTFACTIDLSPNYASILFAICSVSAGMIGFVGPMIVGILTNNNQTIEQWRLVFVIVAAAVFASCVPYLLSGTSEPQPWNDCGRCDEKQEDELQELRPKTSDIVKHDETIEATVECNNDNSLM